jgi:hypothetical protein
MDKPTVQTAGDLNGLANFHFCFWRIIICFLLLCAHRLPHDCIDYRPPWHMVWPFRINCSTCASPSSKHAAIDGILALISFRIPRDSMLLDGGWIMMGDSASLSEG